MPDGDLSRETAAPAAESGLPEEEFSNLMGSISAMAPLLKGFFAKGESHDGHGPPHGGQPYGGPHGGPPSDCHRREALLLALKPYLSPARCAAVDYFIRLARVGDAIRALQ